MAMKENRTLKELAEDVQKGLYFAYTFVLLKRNGAFVKDPMDNGTVKERVSLLRKELGDCRTETEELSFPSSYPSDLWKTVLGLFFAFSIPSVILTYCCFEVFPFKSEYVRILVGTFCLMPSVAGITFLVRYIIELAKRGNTVEFVISLLAGLLILTIMVYLFVCGFCLGVDYFLSIL